MRPTIKRRYVLDLLQLYYNITFVNNCIVYKNNLYGPLEDFFDGTALDCIISYRLLLNAKYYAY